jgi:hypothetical protein
MMNDLFQRRGIDIATAVHAGHTRRVSAAVDARGRMS